MFKKWLQENKGLSIKTCELYIYWIIKYSTIRKFVEDLDKIKGISTRKIIYSALKHFYEFKNMDFNIKINFKNYKPVEKYYATYYDVENVQNNYICNSTWISLRNKILFAFTYMHGLRISEVLSIKKENFKDGFLEIHGKGSKKRFVPFLDIYSKKWIESIDEGFIFTTKKGTKMSYSNSISILEDIKKKCNLNGKLTWHSLRHGYAMMLIKKNVNLDTISKVLGHSSLNTTILYLHNDIYDILDEYKSKFITK